jgi:outer membrane protein assembly factor BamB
MRKPDAVFSFSNERDVVATRPAFHEDSCYFVCSGRTRELVRLRLDDGRVVWRRPCERALVPLLVGNDRIFLSSPREALCTTEGGELVWRFDAALNTWRVWRNCVIAVAGRRLDLRDAGSGQQTVSIDLPIEIWGGLVSGDFFLGFSGAGTEWVGYGLLTNQVMWSAELQSALQGVPPLAGHDIVAKAAGDGEVFVLAYRGHLFGISVSSGEVLWKQPVRTYYPAAVGGSRVYSWHRVDDASHLVCLDARTGNVVFDRDLSPFGEGFSRRTDAYTPIVSDDAVILTTKEGTIAACSLIDGDILWQDRRKAVISSAALTGGSLVVLTGDGKLLKYSLGQS